MADKSLELNTVSDDAVLRAYLTSSQGERKKTLSLIASENYPHPAAAGVLNTSILMSNSEGYPARINGAQEFYAGDESAVALQDEAIDRAKLLFGCSHANVQPLSGSLANIAAINALTKSGDTILTATFESGAGHFSQAGENHITSQGRNVVHFNVDANGLIDYEDTRRKALEHKPKLIIVGGSGYPRQYDFERLGAIAKESGALLMVDMAQIAGLVAAELHPSPFPFADVVTSSTHKTLGGVRGGFILWNDEKFSKQINDAVFPGIQGEPDNAKIAAAASIFYEAKKPAFVEEMKRVVENAKTLAAVLQEKQLQLVTGGTDNHLMTIDLRPLGIDGDMAAKALHDIGIYSNKMPIAGDKLGEYSGLRLGTPSVTRRGLGKVEMRKLGTLVADTLHELAEHKTVSDKALVQSAVEKIAEQFPPPQFGLELGGFNDAIGGMFRAKTRKPAART